MATDRMRQVALGAAVLAVAVVGMTALVVVDRTAPPEAAAATPPPPASRPAVLERHVAAADIVRLRTAHIETATDGIRVGERGIIEPLGLEADDVIVALSGRPLHREFDLIDAMLTLSMMSPTTLYVEIIRGNTHALLVWRVVGDLRAARAAAIDPLRPPPLTAVADPLVATITVVDDKHVTMPGSTADRIISDTPTYLKAVRALPWTSYGVTRGVKLYAIRAGTVIDAIGVKNGDIVRAVNGTEVASIDDVVDQLVKTRRTNLWTIDLERRNKAMILTISIQ